MKYSALLSQPEMHLGAESAAERRSEPAGAAAASPRPQMSPSPPAGVPIPSRRRPGPHPLLQTPGCKSGPTPPPVLAPAVHL